MCACGRRNHRWTTPTLETRKTRCCVARRGQTAQLYLAPLRGLGLEGARTLGPAKTRTGSAGSPQVQICESKLGPLHRSQRFGVSIQVMQDRGPPATARCEGRRRQRVHRVSAGWISIASGHRLHRMRIYPDRSKVLGFLSRVPHHILRCWQRCTGLSGRAQQGRRWHCPCYGN